jgi:hypothetical protein
MPEKTKLEDAVKRSALNNKTAVSAGMLLVGIFAAGSLARSKARKRAG